MGNMKGDFNSEIHENVSNKLAKWGKQQKIKGWMPEFSEGAINSVSQMIINIKEDPSSYWIDVDTTEIQAYAITVIPNVLNEIFLRFRRGGRFYEKNTKITSWEIWHGISDALDTWCPIPKDF